MPLIVITGIPCSTKTTRSLQLKEYFTKKLKDSGQNVEIVSEFDAIIKAGYDKNSFYADSIKEKVIRSAVKSDIERKLDTRDLLIFDGSNYIKGYRYEIYCMTKMYKTPQCTVHCDIPIEHAWLWNNKRTESDQYNREIFDALVMRYEKPDSEDRWDAPLFAVTPEDELMYDEIYRSLYKVKPPKPNQSTQCPPLASANYLHELDTITKKIVDEIIYMEQAGIKKNITVSGSHVTVQKVETPAKLMRLRRQFLVYSKMQRIEINQIAILFVQYINKNL